MNRAGDEDFDETQESFFIQQINNSESSPCSFNDNLDESIKMAEKVFFSKAKVVKEKVEFEEGFDQYVPTLEEVIKFIMIRLAGRFTTEELPYFCEELKRDPTYDIDEGRGNKYATNSVVRAQLATWRKNHVNGNSPLTKEARENLQETLHNLGVELTRELGDMLNRDPAPTGPEVCYLLLAYEDDSFRDSGAQPGEETVLNIVPYETGVKRHLPHIVGMVTPGPKVNPVDVVAVLVDTGASTSLINSRSLRKMGLSESMIDRSIRPRITTASRGVILAEGYIKAKLYMKNKHQKYPYINVNFLVIESASMPAVILGHGELVDGQYTLGVGFGDSDGYALHILAYADKPTQTSQQVIPVIHPDSIKLTNVGLVPKTNPAGKNSQLMVQFVATDVQPMVENRAVRLTASDPKVTFGNIDGIVLDSPEKRIHLNGKNPESVEFAYTLPVNNDSREFQPGELHVYMTEVNSIRPCSLAEMDLYDLNSELNREGTSWDDSEGFLMDRISQCPEYFEAPEGELLIPELDHLPSEYQEKFDQLFRANADLLSQHQFDIGTCKLPPVKIPVTPGVTSQDKPRHYKPEEKQILRDYLKDLLEAGIVKKVATEPNWNHNINLVPKSVDGSRKLDRSKHGKTRIQQLQEHGARFCSDLRGVNKALPNEQMTQLPQFNVMCPMLAAKKICCFDIRSGYFSVMLDEEAQKIFGFQVDNEYYVYTRLVQGFKNSVAIFQHIMSTIFSEQAWDRYRKYIPCLENLNYQDVFSIYVDDLVVAAYDLEQMFYCTEFALMCVKHAGLKFHPKKISIDKPTAEVLGFEISTRKQRYKIASKRAQAMLAWLFPATRDAIISRLASLQYFQQCLPGIRYLVFGLTLLAKSKHDKLYIKKLHKMEFMAMRLLIAMQIEMYLPQLDKPLYVSSDASFSTYAGVIQQKRFLLDEDGNETKEEGMVVCAAMSKNFKQHDLQRAIYQKETHAMIQTLRSFEYWIRAAKSVIFSTDCVFLAHIANLKQQDSKMFSTSLFLSTFGNVYFVHSRGSHFLVTLADLLSRGLGGSEILSAAGIPKEFLEKISNIGDPGRMVISPQALHNLMTAPAPEYTNVPYRKEQRPCPDMLEFSEDQIFNHPTCEAEVITAMFGGYDAIKPDTIAFQNPETKRKMSRTDFAQTERKYNLQNIRQFVEQAQKHQSCDGGKEEQLHQISIYEQDRDFSDRMVQQLKLYLQNQNRSGTDEQMLGLCYSYIAHPDKGYTIVRDLIKTFQESRHYSKTDGELQAVQYIVGTQSDEADVSLEPLTACIGLVMKKDVTLQPHEFIKLKVNTRLATKFEVEFIEKLPNVAVTLGQTESSLYTWLSNLVLFSDSSQLEHVPAGTVVGHLKFHGGGPKCGCSHSLEKGLLLDIVPESRLGENTPSHEALENRMMLFNCMMSVTGERLAKPMAQTAVQGNLGEALYPIAKDNATMTSPNRRELNHIMLLSSLVTNGKILSKEIIRQFQQSCSFLTERRLAVKRGKETKFCEIDGVLYKKKLILGEEVLLLCLDSVTYGFLVAALHQQGYHFSEQVFKAYLGTLFYTQHSKSAIRRGKANCSACYFTRRCFRRKNVVANNFKPQIGARWSSDLIENLERDKHGHKYLCLLIEHRTTFCLTIPLKTTQCAEFTRKLAYYLPVMHPNELVTDFGTLYRGPELKKLLDDNNIVHSKSVPQRPQQNGLAEVSAKEVRGFFRTFLLGLPGDARAKWSEHLYFATTVFNCGIIYAGDQMLTRYNLFFNADRSNNNQFLSALNGMAEQNIRMQAEAMAIIDAKREKARESYDASGLRPFVVDQIVMLISNKAEMQQAGSAAGLEPNSGRLYRVLSVTDSGLGVQCESLMNGSIQTFENSKVVPVDSDTLITGFGFDPTRLSSFDSALFKRGKGNMLLEAIQNSPEDMLPPEFRREPRPVPMDEDPADDEDLEEGEADEPVLDPESVPLAAEAVHPDVLPGNTSHGYNLRPRKQTLHHVQVQPKKTVSWNDTVIETTHDSIAFEGFEPEPGPLELLPAFCRDVPSRNFLYAMGRPTCWTSKGVQPE